MNRIRYIDKEVLCNYDLREEFFEFIGLKIVDMVPLRKVFVLFTLEGKKILKITDSTKKRVDFIDKSLGYIEKSFPKILRYYKNTDNNIITDWNGQSFIVLEMIEGREATFTNPIEVELCARSIANMHEASKGIKDILTEEEIKLNTCANLVEKINKEFDTLKEIKNNVSRFKYKNKFDNMFLECVDKIMEGLKITNNGLQDSKYENLINNSCEVVLCHNDLAHHNFIIDNEEVSVIDFDYCNLGNRVMDIYNFSSKALKNVFYEKNTFDLILESYNNVSSLNQVEMDLLKVLFNYPKDLVTISIDYYLKQKSWEERAFISKFENKLELEEYRNEFLFKI